MEARPEAGMMPRTGTVSNVRARPIQDARAVYAISIVQRAVQIRARAR